MGNTYAQTTKIKEEKLKASNKEQSVKLKLIQQKESAIYILYNVSINDTISNTSSDISWEEVRLDANVLDLAYPEAVNQNELGDVFVDYQSLITLLFLTIQEQDMRIESLEAIVGQ